MYCVQCEQTMRTPVGNGCAYARACAVKPQKHLTYRICWWQYWKVFQRGRLLRVNQVSSITTQTALRRVHFLHIN